LIPNGADDALKLVALAEKLSKRTKRTACKQTAAQSPE